MHEDWAEATLGDVAEIVGGGTPSTSEASYWGEDVVWLTPTEVVKADGTRIGSSGRMISSTGLANSSAKMLPRNTVLLTTRASVGFVALADCDLATNQGFQSLIPGPSVIPEFLMYWVQGNRTEFTSRAGGSTFPEIGKSKVQTIPITLPPLPVQRRIVDLMTHLDAHIANLQAERTSLHPILSLLRERLSQSGGTVPLSDLAALGGIQIGPFGSQLHANEYSDSGVPVVMPRNINDGKVSTEKIKRIPRQVADRLSRHRVAQGDIIFPRRGDLSKRALITEEQAGWICGTGCIRFRPKEGVDSDQLFQSISGESPTNWLIEHAVGTTMLNLNSQIVGALPVITPSQGSEPLAQSARALALLAQSLDVELQATDQTRQTLLSELLNRALTVDASYDSLLSRVT